jgi:hypothetical protein
MLMVFNVIDAFYTLMWIQSGLAVEANPLMNSALSMGPGVFVIIKMTMVTLGLALLWRRRENKFARIAVLLPAVFYAVVVGSHIAHSIRLGLGWSIF